MAKGRAKIAHVAACTPGRCGLYETTRELVLAERRLGYNAHIVDPRPATDAIVELKIDPPKCPHCGEALPAKHPKVDRRPMDWAEDRGVCIAPLKWGIEEADLIVSHSGLSDAWKDNRKPRIHVAHGRPNSSYRLERSGESAILSCYRAMAGDPRWRRMVTLWPGYEHYWRLYFPRTVALDSWVDLDWWGQIPARPYDFGGKAGQVNVVISDVWRLDKDPFHVAHAFAKWSGANPGARLHAYALDNTARGWQPVIAYLMEMGVLGEACPMVPADRLRAAYHAADCVLTPHKVAVRTVREALAAGCPVVADVGNPYTPYTADQENIPAFAEAIDVAVRDSQADRSAVRRAAREVAEKNFDLGRAAAGFAKLIEEVLAEGVPSDGQ